MADGIPLCQLGTVASVQGGFAFKSGDFKEAGVPVLKIKNVRLREVDTTEPSYVPQSIAKDTARYYCKTGDLLISMTGSGPQAPNSVVGRVARFIGPSDKYLINQRVGRFVNKAPSKLDQRYLFYVLARDETLWKLVSVATGSANQANISGAQIENLEVPLPPLADQKAIAAVLGALDDKIELNRRMNATLEAMAQALFQSWFVDFDPVRAKLDGRQPTGIDPANATLFPAAFQESTVGHIPQGWKATRLGEVIEIADSKRIPLSGREREQRKGPFPYHGAASVMDHIDEFLFDGIYVLMGEDGSVINVDGTPVLQYVWGKFWVNNHAHVLRGKNGIGTEHLLLHLKNCNIAPFVNGAVQPKLNQGNMNRIEFILPPPEIGKCFSKMINPLFAQIRANTEQSRTLATLRDSLLPKLLSGQLVIHLDAANMANAA